MSETRLKKLNNRYNRIPALLRGGGVTISSDSAGLVASCPGSGPWDADSSGPPASAVSPGHAVGVI